MQSKITPLTVPRTSQYAAEKGKDAFQVVTDLEEQIPTVKIRSMTAARIFRFPKCGLSHL